MLFSHSAHYTYLQSPQMTRSKKPTLVQESEGEEFSDAIFSSTSEASDNKEEPVEDTWVFPIVGHQAKRAEYEGVCGTKLAILN